MKNFFRAIFRILRLIRADFHAFLQGNSQKSIRFIGVTGTSGKSTTSTMIYHILKSAGVKVGLISTEGAFIDGETFDTGLHVTTPDSSDLYRILKMMKRKGIQWVVLETSSHALDQGRFGNIAFDFAVYTNIKRDHLDWHGSWENYADAKFRLVRMLKKGGGVILNQDDKESFNYLRKKLQFLNKEVNVTSYTKIAEVNQVKMDRDSVSFVYKKTKFDLNILGEYNIENWLAAMKIGEIFKITIDELSSAAKSFAGVEGRMQVMQTHPFLVIVNFAHNADALEKSLISVSKLRAPTGKIIAVFGSAGLRDKEKRFAMGAISGKYADVTIATAEDPRTESLYEINSRIIDGAEQSGAILVKRFSSTRDYLKYKKPLPEISLPTKAVFAFDEASVNSRYDAIDFAIHLAEAGDVVITEGKGHEKSLAFAKDGEVIEYSFSDQDAVLGALKSNM